jgi:hypothetical protein
MNAEMKAKLEKLEARKFWTDDKNFMVDDYACGNINDAYYGGISDGEAALAWELLAEIFGA